MYSPIVALIGLGFLGEVARGIAIDGDLETRARRKKKNKILTTAITCSFVNNPDSVCGVRGTLNYYYGGVASNSIAPDLATCRQFCGNRINEGAELAYDCASFSYNTTSSLCSLYSKRMEQQEFERDPGSDLLLYNSDCITCAPFCPDGSGSDNHLDNAGFELSDTLSGPWEDASYGGRVVSSGGVGGSNAYYCNAGEYLYCDVIQYRNLCLGQLYTITARYRYAPPAAGEPHPSVTVSSDELFSSHGVDDNTEPGVWYTLTYTFRAQRSIDNLPSVGLSTFPSGADNVQSGEGSSRPGIYFDNIVVVPAPSNFSTQGSNPVPNGNFQSGTLGPWSYSWRPAPWGEISDPDSREGNAEVVSPGLTPDSSFAFRYSGGFLGTVVIQSGKFNLISGERYLFEFDYRINQFDHIAYIECVDPGYYVTWVANFRVERPNNSSVRTFRREVTAGASSGCDVRLQFYTRSHADTNSFAWVDNVRVLRIV